MWAVAALAFLAIAIGGHAVLCRLASSRTSVFRFLVAGTIVGISLCAYSLGKWGFTVEAAAAIALYAAACELYIFLFTVTAGSISVSLLYRLRAGALSEAQIEALLGGHSMVDRRVKNMLAVGLLEQARDGYVRTPSGELTLWAYRALRRFFWRTPSLPSLIRRTDPGPLPKVMPEAAVALKSLGEDALACLLLVGAVLAIFWAHVSGSAVFVGDSDRLNHYLTILRVLTDGYRAGTVPTWDDLIFGGFDLVSFTHPYPTSLLHLLWPAEKLFVAAGNVSALLLAASACAAYFFLKDASRRTFPSLVGAALYAMSTLSVLKVSQNDISFSAFVVLPIMMLIIRRARADNSAAGFVGLTASLTYLLVFAFLQKAAYVLLLGAAYAIYRSFREKTPRTAVVFGLSGLTSVVAAFPRIYSMGEEFLTSARHQFVDAPAANLRAAAVTESYEVLRWFDDRIFGPFAAEVAVRNAGVNLHEGFLLYMSTFSALLILFTLVRKLVAWMKDRALHLPEATFHIGIVAFCFLVILTTTGDQLMYHAFLRIDFIHARIAIIALLPLCALVVLSLLTLYPRQEASVPLRIGMLLTSGSGAVVALLLIDAFAGRFEATYLPIRWPGANALVFISASAAVHILLSVAVFCVVLTMRWVFKNEGVVKQLAVYALGFLMFGQAFIYAKNQIAGEHMRSPGAMPFAKHIRLLAEPGDFHGPSSAAVEALRNRLEADNYRSSIICDPGRTAIYCSTHIAHFWRLRMVDGYLNAVPTRIAALPFGSGTLGARVLRFATLEQLQWPLLAMLNVKYVLEADRALFTNVVTLPGGRARELQPDDIRVVENPVRPAPRLFFAESVESVGNMRASVERLFPSGKVSTSRVDVERHSYAEGFPRDASFPASGAIHARFSLQTVEIEVEPAATPRFLVVNERFHPRWKAYERDTELPIYPTNVFMRGIVVPAGAKLLTLRYVPFIYTPPAIGCYIAAVLMLLIGAWTLRLRRRASLSIDISAPFRTPAAAPYLHNRKTGE